MEIEIPISYYEVLLRQAAETELSVEEIVERAIMNHMDRSCNNAK